MFRPPEAIFRENTHIKGYIFYIKGRCRGAKKYSKIKLATKYGTYNCEVGGM
jgi:hypothetical protein